MTEPTQPPSSRPDGRSDGAPAGVPGSSGPAPDPSPPGPSSGGPTADTSTSPPGPESGGPTAESSAPGAGSSTPPWSDRQDATTAQEAPPTASLTPAATEPVAGAPTEPATPRRGSRLRWGVALGATLLVVAAAAGLFFFLNRTSTAPAGAATYLPASSVAYGEVRLDLPGDQRAKVGQFLSRFPGFADQAQLEAKIDEVFDRTFRAATQERYTYSRDVKPWFNGQLSFGVLTVPEPGAGEAKPPAVLAIVGVKDQARAQTELDRLRGEATKQGVAFTSQDHQGRTIWTATPPAGAGDAATRPSYALTPDAVLFGTSPDDIRLALDIKAGRQGAPQSLAAAGDFRASLERTGGDRLATFVVNLGQLRDRFKAAIPSGDPSAACARESFAQLPDQVLATVRADDDRIVAESRARPAQGTELPPVRDSGLANRVGSGALFYFETRDAGKAIHKLVAQLKGCLPAGQPEAERQIQQVEALLGAELESYLDWLGDVAVTGSFQGGTPSGGLVATVTDETLARERVNRLDGFVRLAVAQAGPPGVTVSEEDYKGAKISKVEVDLDAARGGTEPGAGPLPVPFPGGRLVIAYTVHQGVFVLGLGDAFVKGAIDGAGAQSLASQPRFQDAVKALGGQSNASVSWVDVAAIRALVEPQLPADVRAQYERDVKPYLTPIDSIVAVGTVDGQELVTRAAVFVSK